MRLVAWLLGILTLVVGLVATVAVFAAIWVGDNGTAVRLGWTALAAGVLAFVLGSATALLLDEF